MDSRLTLDEPIKRRIALVDVLRGCALIAMAVYHFVWDLAFFELADFGPTENPFWIWFARATAGQLSHAGRRRAHSRAWRRREMAAVPAPSPCHRHCGACHQRRELAVRSGRRDPVRHLALYCCVERDRTFLPARAGADCDCVRRCLSRGAVVSRHRPSTASAGCGSGLRASLCRRTTTTRSCPGSAWC